MYSEPKLEDLQKMISSIHDELSSVVKIVSETDCDGVLMMGRKANLLFHQVAPQIISSGKVVTLVDSLSGARLFFTKARYGKFMIAADSIRTGNELDGFFKSWKEEDKTGAKEVVKVVCYVGYQEGLQRLEKNGLSVISLHPCKTIEEYVLNTKKLQIYYQSQIQPVEIDLPYDTYTIKYIKKRKLLNILKRALHATFCDRAKIQTDKIRSVQDIVQISSRCNLLHDCECLKRFLVFNRLRELGSSVLRFVTKVQFGRLSATCTTQGDILIDFSVLAPSKDEKKDVASLVTFYTRIVA